jgi:hypothetical protein
VSSLKKPLFNILIVIFDSSTSVDSYDKLQDSPYHLLRLEEVMLAPIDLLGWAHILLGLRVQFLAKALDLYHGIDSGTILIT